MKHGRLDLYPIGNVDRAWSPFSIGTYKDVEEAGILLAEGMKLQFYDEDAHAQGNPDDLLFVGTAHLVEGKGLGAISTRLPLIGNLISESCKNRSLKVDLAGVPD